MKIFELIKIKVLKGTIVINIKRKYFDELNILSLVKKKRSHILPM